MLAALLLIGPRGQAQDAPAGADAGPAPVVLRDEVDLRVAKAGPGGRTRAGDWGGILVEFRDSALEPREIVLRLTGYDRDGDPPEYDRVVVGDPERARTAWMYAKLPYPENAARVTITAHEAIESADAPGGLGYRAGRVLGRTWVDSTRLVAPEYGLLGVVGSRDFGLRRYATALTSSIECLPLGHEHTEVVTGLTDDDLPDRWQGLLPYDVIVWGRGVDPTTLGPERARALIEWIRRGGHFIVVLPPVGQEWTVSARNPLSQVMPAMRVDRRENASLEPYRALLTLSRDATLPRDSVVHVFTPAPDAGPLEAMAVLAGPDGGCVVMRRLFGDGMVTVVGLDLAAGGLVASGTLKAEAFWHRVLGRRHSLESYQEIHDRDPDQKLSSAIQQRAITDYDSDIENVIDRTGDASKGVLLGLVVFALYWLFAGPVGYLILGRTGQRSHAWLAFVALTALFTAAAWLGASALRPKHTGGNHLAFLDQIHGVAEQRARVWMSVLVPTYGDATIAVGDGGLAAEDLIAPWSPPPPVAAGGGFPDNRGYVLSARRPDAMTVPVRSTIKQVRVDWAGDNGWGTISPVRQPGDLDTAAIRLVNRDRGVLSGHVTHDLPGPLENVLLVVVAGQTDVFVTGRTPRWMPSHVYTDKVDLEKWNPGQPLDLGALTGGTPRAPNGAWFDKEALIGLPRAFTGQQSVRDANPDDRFTAISFAHMLGAPEFIQMQQKSGASPIVTERETHGLDLSRWFTQPCVIIVGQLVQDGGAPPAPITVNGKPLESKGRTVVRWVCPLDPAPPAVVANSP
ncbi:MAG: hypothetical protein H6810_00025 [Phycisphaeraceae bacterium]|nr:MAG: hypothetical protein H6810_00025 [Phycisphaeraceae bacterium]